MKCFNKKQYQPSIHFPRHLKYTPQLGLTTSKSSVPTWGSWILNWRTEGGPQPAYVYLNRKGRETWILKVLVLLVKTLGQEENPR